MTKSVDDDAVAPARRDDRAAEPIEASHLARIEAGLADVRDGRLATHAEVDAVFARFRREP